MKNLLLIGLIFLLPAVSFAQDGLLIAAASDLKFALDSVISVFQEENKANVKSVYGSSGKLTEQIMHGAPFDIFLSADVEYPQKLKTAGKAASGIYEYARGRLVLWNAKQLAPESLDLLRDRSIKKIAIANPAHAPYGRRAVEVLENTGLYNSVKGKLVYGENISQAAQFVLSGGADAGIIALSLALSPNMKNEGAYLLIPEHHHKPLIQGAVIIRKSTLATKFFEFLQSDEAKNILKHYGFSR